MTRSRGPAHRSLGAAAFSLIEVLIGILILAIGLLGLGMIIPVVVREQRAGSDLTLGEAAAQDAIDSLLRSRADLDPATSRPTLDPSTGWDVWLDDNGNSGWSSGAESYLWQTWRGQGQPTTAPNEVNRTTGDLTFGQSGDPFMATIRVADRLWPPLSRQGSATIARGLDPYRPQFVWDFVGRRMPTTAGEPEKIQLALFVRRIDLNIRVPRADYPGSNPARSVTLYDVLADRSLTVQGPFPFRVPVCAYPGNGGGTGTQYLPSNAGILPPGTGLSDLNYSLPLVLDADFDPVEHPRRDRLELDGSGFALTRNHNLFRLVSQPGQRLVDNLGNIYTVQAEADENPGHTHVEVRIDPPIPAWVPRPTDPDPPNLPAGARNPAKLTQIVFVPQIPATVKVITITRPVP